MKSVLDCDAVFDRMTRAPFPAGDSHDEEIELHLQVCHDCRTLAEALRPAVNLFHESLDNADSLPRYDGRLANEVSCEVARSPRSTHFSALFVAGLAASLLFIFGGISAQRDSDSDNRFRMAAAVPDARGLLTLRELHLPSACLSRRDRQAAVAVRVRSDQEEVAFNCCTQCHRFGGSAPASARALRALDEACSACHRPPESATAIHWDCRSFLRMGVS